MKKKNSLVDEIAIENEINILQALDHPNILKIFEFDNNPDSYVMISKYWSKENCIYKLNLNKLNINYLFYFILSNVFRIKLLASKLDNSL